MTAPRKRKSAGGRPSLSGRGPARRVEIKLAPADHKRWQAAASEMGVDSVSQLVRESVETAIARGSTR